jgi:hypothetical protein
MAARVSDVETFEGGDFGAARAVVLAAEAKGDLLEDGNLSDVLGMGYLQITNA